MAEFPSAVNAVEKVTGLDLDRDCAKGCYEATLPVDEIAIDANATRDAVSRLRADGHRVAALSAWWLPGARASSRISAKGVVSRRSFAAFVMSIATSSTDRFSTFSAKSARTSQTAWPASL